METGVQRDTRGGGDRKREREVYEAAARIFYEKGYQAATVQDVADALGILKGSLYHYIDSKEDLLFELLVEAHEDVDAVLTEVAEVPGLSPLERLERYIYAQILYSAQNPHKVSVYYADLDRLQGERRELITARRAEHEAFVRELIAEAQRAGDAGEGDPVILSNCVFATVIWVYRWYRSEGPIEPEELARNCAAFAVAGVKAGIAAAPRAG